MNIIGDYFGLEFKQGKKYHPNDIKLDIGRTSFEYMLRAKQIQKDFLS